MNVGSRVIINDKDNDILYGKIGHTVAIVKGGKDPLWNVKLKKALWCQEKSLDIVCLKESKLMEIAPEPDPNAPNWDMDWY